MMDERHWWIISKLQESFTCLYNSEIPASHYATIVENFIMEESTLSCCNLFFKAGGPRMLIFQCREANSVEEMNAELVIGGKTKLMSVSDGQEQIKFTEGKGFYFIRIDEDAGIPVDGFEKYALCGEIVPPVLSSFEMNMDKIYLPILRKEFDWDKCTKESSHAFLQSADKLSNLVAVTVGGINDKKITLKMPPSSSFANIQKTAMSRTVPPEVMLQFEKCVEDWFNVIDTILQKSALSSKTVDPLHGPLTEWETWKQRQMDLSSIQEQLRSQECKTILAALVSSKSKLLKKWKVVDSIITDSFNEAKDNVKYLELIRKSTEELYTGNPISIVQCLPNIMANIKMIHNVAKYYGTERLTILFMKITNQIIINCLHFLKEENEDIWAHDPTTLIKKLQLCLTLYSKYQEGYRHTKDKVNTTIKGKALELNESRLFGRLDRFSFRIRQIIEVLSTSSQFQDLYKHAYYSKIKKQLGLFESVVRQLKGNSEDVFHFESKKGDFEMNYLAFVKQVEELENFLRKFIGIYYKKVNNPDIALQELQNFRKIVKRPNLKADIELKYSEIYGKELEFVQKLYEKFKHHPPVERNSGRISGYIRWSRHLLQRIEDPMNAFKQFKTVISTREGKKIIKIYNKVASALIEFEALWHNHWVHKVESLKLNLNAPLLCKHPKTQELLVNLDYNILEVIKEARGFIRLEMSVPIQARNLLNQESKLRSYKDQLGNMLDKFKKLRCLIEPNLSHILHGYIKSIYAKIEPGFSTLSWSLMNIDAYLYRIESSFKKLESLLRKINDVLRTAVWGPLKRISNSSLLNISKNCQTLDAFAEEQQKFIATKTDEVLFESNRIKDAVQLIVKLISEESPIQESAVDYYFTHYAHLFRFSLINVIKNSLNELKASLLCNMSQDNYNVNDLDSIAATKPLLKVDVELNVPDFGIYPSLDRIRHNIAKIMSSILSSASHIPIWVTAVGENQVVESFYPLVVDDEGIVRSVFILSNAVERWKMCITDYLKAFGRFSHLWTLNMQEEYDNFLKTNPSVSAFEAKIQSFVKVEEDLMNIPYFQNIGPLCVCTESLKFALKAEISTWKGKFAQILHENARKALNDFLEYMENSTTLLENHVVSLDDLKKMMKILDEVQDKDLEIDLLFSPVEDMYSLLSLYSVRLPHEEIEKANSLRVKWKILKNKVLCKDNDLVTIKNRFRRELEKHIKAFTVDVIQFRNDFDANGPLASGLNPAAGIRRLKNFSRIYEEKLATSMLYAEGEKLFSIPVTNYPELTKTGEDLDLLNSLYNLYTKLVFFDSSVRDTLWEKVDFTDLQKKVVFYAEEEKKLDRKVRDWDAGIEIKHYIKEYQETLPVLIALSSDSIKNRHWLQVMNITGKSFNLDTNFFKLSHLLDAELLRFREDLNEICVSANREMELEIMLTQIEEDWSEQVLSFENFKEFGKITLNVPDITRLLELLEESQISLGTMLNSKYVSPLREEVTNWVSVLGIVSDVVEQWVAVQNLWMYMEAVFADEIIAKELPQETERFSMIDRNWRKIMHKANEVPNVIQCCYGNDALKHLLQHLSDQLELCQKSLVEYLHAKRQIFPRFFFVSDPVLLAMLSNTDNLDTVIPHLKSIFGNVSSLFLDRENRSVIKGVYSSEGDLLKFENPVKFEGKIEILLQQVLEEMKKTLQLFISRVSKEVIGTQSSSIVMKNDCQVAIAGLQVQWTQMTEDTFHAVKTDKKALYNQSKVISGSIQELIQLLSSDVADNNITRLDVLKLETGAIIKMIHRDIVEELSRKRVKDVYEFEWQKHCRHYYNTEKAKVVVHISNVRCTFNHEYLGSKRRIVMTPLTEKCFVALTQTVKAFKAGVPFGPAGTGKSELVKELGFITGNYTIVLNCTEQIDHVVLGRTLKGALQSGSWSCFDNLHSISVGVISVFAEQLKSVFNSLQQSSSSCTFIDGQPLKVNSKCALFMTLNLDAKPSFRVPINLKSVFREIALIFPETEIIIRSRLGAHGFLEARTLAKKICVFYKMCNDHLSHQFHYDFGLRAACSLVDRVISQKRDHCASFLDFKTQSALIKHLIRELNFPRLVQEDIYPFKNYLNDTFRESGNVNIPQSKNLVFEKAVERQIAETGLMPHSSWIKKVTELHVASSNRSGVAVVGPPGCGKSKCIETLVGVLNRLQQGATSHRIQRISPCAVSVEQLFGYFSDSYDWIDGIVSALWRKAIKTKNTNTWFCFDGPTSRTWMDHLNSVLDENAVLALINGDRLQSAGQIRVIIETTNLTSASPAAVSRSAVIYIPETCLGWKPLVDAWLKTRRSVECNHLRELCDQNLGKIVLFATTELTPVMSVCTVGMIKTFLKLLEAILADSSDLSEGLNSVQYKRAFYFASTWAFGGLLSSAEKEKFHSFIVGISKCYLEDDVNTVFDLYVDESYEWETWQSKVPSPKSMDNNGTNFARFISTPHSVRVMHLVGLVHKASGDILLTGVGGVGKSSIIRQFLTVTEPSSSVSKWISFSGVTTPTVFQQSLDSFVRRRQGHIYGADDGKKLNIFIDNINMVNSEIQNSGSESTCEIVRQLIEDKGLYDTTTPGEWKQIADCTLFAAMRRPENNVKDIPPRLKTQFAIFDVAEPTEDSLYSQLMMPVFLTYGEHSSIPTIRGLSRKLIGVSLHILSMIKQTLPVTISNWFYEFNYHDVVNIFWRLLKLPLDKWEDTTEVVGLFIHENIRVYTDRITNENDINLVYSLLKKLIGEKFEIAPQEFPLRNVIYGELQERKQDVDDQNRSSVLDSKHSLVGMYSRYEDCSTAAKICNEYLRLYNDENQISRLDIVLFEDNIKYILRISRIINMSNGHAILIGSSSHGRKSLCTLAAYMSDHILYKLKSTRSYHVADFMDDLRVVYRLTGFSNKKVTFLVSHSETNESGILSIINDILTGNGSELHSLFKQDEMEMLLNELKPIIKKESPASLGNPGEFFLSRVRANLHFVITFPSEGLEFKQACSLFSGFLTGCHLISFAEWPTYALKNIAEKLLHENDKLDLEETEKAKVSDYLVEVHDAVEEVCEEYHGHRGQQIKITPKTYLIFLNQLISLYSSKKQKYLSLVQMMEAGLAKLETTREELNSMEEQLVQYQNELAKSDEYAESFMTKVKEAALELERERATLSNLQIAAAPVLGNVNGDPETYAEGIMTEEQVQQANAEMYNKALANVGMLSKTDVDFLRSMAQPPLHVKIVMDIILILLMKPLEPVCLASDMSQELLKITDSWSIASLIMADTWFLDSLINFDASQLNGETSEFIEPYLNIPEFEVAAVKEISEFCAVLLEFVQALKRNSEFAYEPKKEVNEGPKDQSSETLADKDENNEEVDMAMDSKVNFALEEEQIAKYSAEIKEVSERVNVCFQALEQLQVHYDEALTERQSIYEKNKKFESRLMSAKSLLQSLQTAKNRWISLSELYTTSLPTLLGNSLISSAFLCFCGPFNAIFRERLESEFLLRCKRLKIPVKSDISVVDFLVDQGTVKSWTTDSLSSDRLSVENACIVTLNSHNWPLLLDPQGRGVEWIIKKERKKGLVVTKHSPETFRNQLETCAFKGQTLLLVDVDPQKLWNNPHVKALLLTSTPSNQLGGRPNKFLIGEKEIDCHHNFRFYMATKLNNAVIPEDFATHTNIVNFIVTRDSLIEHLLNNVVNHEKPELEVERKKVQVTLNELTKKAEELEQNALGLLITAGESFVESDDLIESLTCSKEKLINTYNNLQYAQLNEKEIQENLQEYIGIAIRGAVIYEAISELSTINNMYSTSLDQYLRIFHHAVESAERSPLVSKRIENIIECLTYVVYVIVTRGLYEDDKPIFLMLLCSKIAKTKGEMSQEEYQFLLKGGQNADLKSGPRKPSEWITEETWKNIIELSKFEKFHDVPVRMARYEHSWKEIMESDTPETCILPDGLHDKLNKIQRFMMLRALRTDRVLIGLKIFARDTLGKQYIQAIPLKPEAALSLCTKTSPLLVILTEESSDPVPMLEGIAKGMKKEVITLSLGQAQTTKCIHLLKESMKSGSWLILQNAHLVPETLEKIEKILEESGDSINEEFRLLILASQTPDFPMSLLHVCVRLVIEPSYQLSDGMKRCIMWIGNDRLAANKRPEWVPFLYSLCFLHSVIRSRRKFQDYGWCNHYSWGTSDLESVYMFAQRQFESSICSKTNISFSSIKYAISEVVYGGRVTDPYDQRVLNLFVDKWIGPQSCNAKFEFDSGYAMPSAAFQSQKNLKLEDLLLAVNSLPLAENPELYGLTPAAEIRYRKKDAEYVFEILSDIMYKNIVDNTNVVDRETRALEIMNELTSKMPKEFVKDVVSEKMKKIGSGTPFGHFILREIECMRQLLQKIKVSLAECKNSLKGKIITSEGVNEVINCMSVNKVPREWTTKVWDRQSFPLSSWFVEVNARCDQLWNCLHKERPTSYSLGNFVNPKGLLTVVKQESLRLHPQWSIENLVLNSEVTSRDKDHVSKDFSNYQSQSDLFILTKCFLK